MILGSPNLDIVPESNRGSGNANFSMIKVSLGNMTIFLCYRHKNYCRSLFSERLKCFILGTEGLVIVVGDLKTDLIRSQHFSLVDFFRNLGLQNVLPNVIRTTIYGTYIDICFSNCERVQAFVYDSYYSTYKAFCVFWN